MHLRPAACHACLPCCSISVILIMLDNEAAAATRCYKACAVLVQQRPQLAWAAGEQSPCHRMCAQRSAGDTQPAARVSEWVGGGYCGLHTHVCVCCAHASDGARLLQACMLACTASGQRGLGTMQMQVQMQRLQMQAQQGQNLKGKWYSTLSAKAHQSESVQQQQPPAPYLWMDE